MEEAIPLKRSSRIRYYNQMKSLKFESLNGISCQNINYHLLLLVQLCFMPQDIYI